MHASTGACSLLHLRCTYQGVLQITGFTHHRLCGVKILHVIALSPTLSFPRQIHQPCLSERFAFDTEGDDISIPR